MARSQESPIEKVALFFVQAPSWLIFSLLISSVAVSPMLERFMETHAAYTVGFFVTLFVHYLWICSVLLMIYKKFSDYLVVPIMRPFFCVGFLLAYSLLVVAGAIPEKIGSVSNFVSVCCQIYVIYFFSKLLVMVEQRRKVYVREWLPTFLLAVIELIGVWFIQPRVNRLFITKQDTGH
jgi:hypothetical protein